MNRIAYISRIFRLLFQIVFVFMPLFTIVSWLVLPSTLHLGVAGNGLSYSPIPEALHIAYVMTSGIKVLGFLINMLTVGTAMLILYFLIKLFRNYERQQIFSLANVRILRNVGYTLIIWQILIPIQQALLSVVLTWNNGPGQRFLAANFSSNNLVVILIACIVILISWIMAEAHKLQEEHEYTV